MAPKAGSYFFWWVLIAVMFCALPLFAATIEKPLPQPAQEERARHLFDALRCVVCEGQSLADSDTTMAAQMRAHVRGMVRDGKSDAQVLDYFTDHYGPSVLMAPPFAGDMGMIWLLPVLLLLFGILCLWRVRRAK